MFLFLSVLLEAAADFPVGDAAVIFELLPLGGVDIMVDDVIAEGLAQKFRTLENRPWPCIV